MTTHTLAPRRAVPCAVALLAFLAGGTTAQDARSVVQAAAAAINLSAVRTIQYSGTGWTSVVGQNFTIDEDWPRFEMASYTRTIDYEARASRDDATLRQGTYPPNGGGGRPIRGERRTVALLAENFAWNLQGDRPIPQTRAYLDGIPVNELRQLEILLTPHGFLKAALATNAKAQTLTFAAPSSDGLTGGGRRATIVSFTALGKYTVNGTINDQNLVEVVTTWIPNPIYGDMLYEARYTDYRDAGGTKFPMQIHVHQGDPALSAAHHLQQIAVTDVQVNGPPLSLVVPDTVRSGKSELAVETQQGDRLETQMLTDGVWLLAGGLYNSVAVEFRDWMAVIEAPLNEERSLAVIDAVARLAPNKPIRYLLNTHHHFDHSGGIRTFVAQGATLVTHESNRDFYRNVMFHRGSRVLQPDRLAAFYPVFAADRHLPMETANQLYTLSDGTRTIEMHLITGLQHVETMLAPYLPREKLLVNADLYSPPAAGVPTAPTFSSQALAANIRRLNLDVARHVPIHGRVGTHEEFLKIVGAEAR